MSTLYFIIECNEDGIVKWWEEPICWYPLAKAHPPQWDRLTRRSTQARKRSPLDISQKDEKDWKNSRLLLLVINIRGVVCRILLSLIFFLSLIYLTTFNAQKGNMASCCSTELQATYLSEYIELTSRQREIILTHQVQNTEMFFPSPVETDMLQLQSLFPQK